MDNRAAPKSAAVRHLIEAAGAGVRFLPAYSPDLNPIEPFDSAQGEARGTKVKAPLRSAAARTIDALHAAIAEAVAAITAADCLGWFEPCGYHVN